MNRTLYGPPSPLLGFATDSEALVAAIACGATPSPNAVAPSPAVRRKLRRSISNALLSIASLSFRALNANLFLRRLDREGERLGIRHFDSSLFATRLNCSGSGTCKSITGLGQRLRVFVGVNKLDLATSQIPIH